MFHVKACLLSVQYHTILSIKCNKISTHSTQKHFKCNTILFQRQYHSVICFKHQYMQLPSSLHPVLVGSTTTCLLDTIRRQSSVRYKNVLESNFTSDVCSTRGFFFHNSVMPSIPYHCNN